MLPSVVASELEQVAADAIRTAFHPTTPGFSGLIDRFLADRSFADGFFALGTDSTETGLVSTGTAVFIGPPNRVFVILNDINRLYFCSA